MNYLNLVFIAAAAVNAKYRAEALGPLNRINDWGTFAADMQKLKATGVEAFASDVWWGWVEPQDNQFDWTYYDRMSKIIIDAGLKWIPILSTHQCGGPGQECFIPLPSWTGVNSNVTYQFVDVFGNANSEALAPFVTDYSIKQYDELFAAFAARYTPIKEHVVRIDLSGGISGELRYPSYSNFWSYPGRGRLQAYSPAAVASFRNWVFTKYGSLSALSAAWGTTISSLDDVRPPCDVTTERSNYGVCAGKTGLDQFFSLGVRSVYGKDFGTWYQDVLLKYSEKLSAVAHKHFDPVFNCKIAIKVAGVHWQYFNPGEARSAERATGYWDYSVILNAFKAQRVEATFTAIEMNDDNQFPTFSGAKTLTREFYSLCRSIGADCGSENALPIGGPGGPEYPNMRNVLSNFPILSLTYLRYNFLTSSLPNAQAFANYVSAIGAQSSVFFQVNGITTQLGQSLVIVGNHPTLGAGDVSKALKMAPYSCNGSQCTWIGTLKASSLLGSNIQFQIAVVGPNAQTQCGSYSFTPTTTASNLFINQGNGDFTNDGIRTVRLGSVNLSCGPLPPATSTVVPPVTSTVAPVPTTTPSTSASVNFKITRDAGFGDRVYVVGTFNSWNPCNALPCNFSSGNVWNCGPLILTAGRTYEFKPLQYGSGSKTTCSAPVWKQGGNSVFTASEGLVISDTY